MLGSQEAVTAREVDPAWPKVSLVVPTLDEAENLPWLMKRLMPGLHEVILVDGNSTDGTPDIARRHRPDVRVIDQTGRGKGNAIACGLAAAEGDVVVMLDADGSTDPREIERFVGAILHTPAQVVKGSRYVPGGGSSDITRTRSAGNRLLVRLVNLVAHTRYTDLCYGYMAFDRRCIPRLDLETVPAGHGSGRLPLGAGFEIETLLTLRAAHQGLEVVEVPSFERARGYGESRLNTWRDGTRILRVIWQEQRRRVRRAAQPADLPARRRCAA